MESGFKPGIEPGNGFTWAFLVLLALFGERLPGESRGARAGGIGSGGIWRYLGIFRSRRFSLAPKMYLKP
jgi:hypothetical protein